MNKELKQKWIAALRSGKYKQHRGSLANNYRTAYCCLGVLSCIERGEDIPPNTYVFRYYPEATKEIENEFIDLNDKEEMSFNEIADYIETNIEDD